MRYCNTIKNALLQSFPTGAIQNVMAKKVEKGTEVFIPQYKVFGKVVEVADDGTITKVKIETPLGEEIVETARLVVEIVRLVKGLWSALKSVFSEFAGLFKR
jgi:hypothetical protein